MIDRTGLAYPALPGIASSALRAPLVRVGQGGGTAAPFAGPPRPKALVSAALPTVEKIGSRRVERFGEFGDHCDRRIPYLPFDT